MLPRKIQENKSHNVRLLIDANGNQPVRKSEGDAKHIYDDMANEASGKQKAGGKPIREKI